MATESNALRAGPDEAPATGMTLSGPGFAWDADELEARVAVRVSDIAGEPRVRIRNAEQSGAFVVDCLAIWRLGGVVVPLRAGLAPERRDAVAAEVAAAELPPAAAAVLWTSGTSGRSRGVVVGHGGLTHVCTESAKLLGVTGEDVWGLTLSPAHMGGLVTVWRAAVLGHGLWVGGPFDAAAMDAAIEDGSLQFVSLVPTMLARWLRIRGARPLPATFRGVLLGGAAAPRGLIRQARSLGVPVFMTYGMTETSSQVATGTPELADQLPGCVGPVLDGVPVRISRAGEILVKGPTLALGILDGESLPLDDDGWYHTGDLGHLDQRGILSVLGRANDRIISGGVNVDPLEVEEVLRRHQAVRDVCVVGVPDAEWGERVAALVVWDAARPEETLDDWCRGHLPAAERPRIWVRTEAIPVNANGKPDRLEARALVQEAGAEGS